MSDDVESGQESVVLFRRYRTVSSGGYGGAGVEAVRISQSEKVQFHRGVLAERRLVGQLLASAILLLFYVN